MRIIIFIDGLRSGGKERRCIELLKSLEDHPEYDIHIVSLRDEIVYPEFFSLKYPYHLIKKKNRDLSIFRKFYKLCKEIKPDIVHCWSSMNTTYALYAKVKLGFKIINSQITDAPLHINWLSIFGLQTKLNFMFSDVILANSRAGVQAYHPPQKKSTYIHNGFDLNRIKRMKSVDDIRKDLNIKTKYLIIMVGAFAERKDYQSYIEVAKDICSERDDITFMGIGEGKDLEKFRDETKSYERIKLPGRLENIESIINAADICILMSNGKVHGEGISNSIMEYMALGKPVIASHSGGTPEIIDHDHTGIIIPDKAKNDLKRHISYLLQNDVQRENMGLEGKNRIKEHFNLDRMADRFMEVYNKTNDEHETFSN